MQLVTAIHPHKERWRYKAPSPNPAEPDGILLLHLRHHIQVTQVGANTKSKCFSFQFQLSRRLSPSPIRRRATSHLKPPMLFHVSSSVSSGVRLSPPLRTLWQWDAILFISTRSRLFPTDSPRCRFCCIHAVHFSCLSAQVFVGCIYFLHAPQGFYMHYVRHLWVAVHWPLICIWRQRGAENETDSWQVNKQAVWAAELRE